MEEKRREEKRREESLETAVITGFAVTDVSCIEESWPWTD